MMGQIIKSKNSSNRFAFAMKSGLLRIQPLAFAIGAWTLFSINSYAAVALPKLPVIQNVGVIPLQWEGESRSLDDVRQTLAEEFPKSVRESRRFRVLGDDLVESLWNSPTGREELRGEFELHSYIGLTVSPRGDLVQLTARLMDSWLKTNLLETDTVPRSWMASADQDDISERLQKLIFRLFNRLPVDLSITSVNGGYITLSGGSEQGIKAGDKVNLIRTTVKSLHPANGTWLDFGKLPLGSAQVIEVKSYTSVARIKEQVKDGAIEAGDGAKIPSIASRVKFARLADDASFKDAGDQGTIIVPPLYQGEQPKAPVKPQPKQLGANTPNLIQQGERPSEPAAPQRQALEQRHSESAPADSDSQSAEKTQADSTPQNHDESSNERESTPPGGESGPSVWEQFASEATSHKLIDEVNAYAGPYWWSVKGPVNSSGQFPLYLLNSAGGGLTRTMFYKIKAAFGGGAAFGNTPSGTYLGYDGYARLYWEEPLQGLDGLLKYWRAGGASRLSGMSAKGNYGGGDWIRGGAMGGIGGTLGVGDDQRYDWFTDFMLMPLNIGRVGYSNSFKSVESAFGYTLALGAYLRSNPNAPQWGGAFEFADERQTLKNNRIPHFNEYSIKLLVKYGL